jgi:hypothetical protein
MEKLVLPQALGKAPAMWYFLPSGIGHAQDQHVLGQPTLVAAHGGCNAQCQALFAQQSVAAVA